MKEILLETMDGYQFQKLVANVFKRQGFLNVKVGPKGADMGIDITMKQKTGMNLTVGFAVQCKHHPENVIGRPVVQKLHSAIVVSPNVDKGLVVTSGRFSEAAIKYAEKIGVDLIDGDKLIELGKQLGIPVLYKKRVPIAENCFPISDKSKVTEKLIGFLELDLKGFSQELFKVDQIDIRLIPTYMVDYYINATFSTSVGVVHSVGERSSVFFLGDSGNLIHPIVREFLLKSKWTISRFDEKNLKNVEIIERRKFEKSFEEIKTIAVDSLIRAYTKTVSYYGKNNVRYTKTCVPTKKHITIENMSRVYFSAWNIIFLLKKRKYVIGALENSELPTNTFEVLPSSFVTFKEETAKILRYYPEKCMLCYKELKHEKFLCNDCGMVVCNKDGFECKVCGKTICREDTIFKRKYLILKEKFCSDCARSEGILGTIRFMTTSSVSRHLGQSLVNHPHSHIE